MYLYTFGTLKDFGILYGIWIKKFEDPCGPAVIYDRWNKNIYYTDHLQTNFSR